MHHAAFGHVPEIRFSFPAVKILTVEQGGESFRRGIVFFRARQLFDADVAELHVIVVAEKTDVPTFAQQTRMFQQCLRVMHVVQVRVHDDVAVQDDLDVPSVRCDFLLIPFTDFFCEPVLGGDNVINRAMKLRGANVCVLTPL